MLLVPKSAQLTFIVLCVGTIPSEIGLLPNMVLVGIGGDIETGEGRIVGTIPTGGSPFLAFCISAPTQTAANFIILQTELGLLSDAMSISLRDTPLTGPIPSELGLLRASAVRLGIRDTLVTGKLNEEMHSICKLCSVAHNQSPLVAESRDNPDGIGTATIWRVSTA